MSAPVDMLCPPLLNQLGIAFFPRRIPKVQYVEFHHPVVQCNGRIGIAVAVIFIP